MTNQESIGETGHPSTGRANSEMYLQNLGSRMNIYLVSTMVPGKLKGRDKYAH